MSAFELHQVSLLEWIRVQTKKSLKIGLSGKASISYRQYESEKKQFSSFVSCEAAGKRSKILN